MHTVYKRSKPGVRHFRLSGQVESPACDRSLKRLHQVWSSHRIFVAQESRTGRPSRKIR